MANRNLLLGLGIGLIISSTVFYISFIFSKPILNNDRQIEISNEEIIKKAKDLGMILVNEIPSAKQQTLSNDDIISQAEKLGMVFKPVEPSTIIESTQNTETLLVETSPPETETIVVPTEVETKLKIIDVRIEPGSSAVKTCEVLYDLGLIDSIDGFLAYLRKNNKTNLIRAGYFKIPDGSSYSQVLKILTTPPK